MGKCIHNMYLPAVWTLYVHTVPCTRLFYTMNAYIYILQLALYIYIYIYIIYTYNCCDGHSMFACTIICECKSVCCDVGSGREVCKWSKNLKCKARNATLCSYSLFACLSFIYIVLLHLALYNCIIYSVMNFFNILLFSG